MPTRRSDPAAARAPGGSARLRAMTAADIEPASAAIVADDWGDRRTWFDYVVASPTVHGFVAEASDGALVGTAVAAIHGDVAWIGTIWVRTAARGQGLGQALTAAALDAAEEAGCATQVLVATAAGRPLYERLGFKVQTWYRTMDAPGRVAPAPRDVQPFQPADLAPMIELDRMATGEDRSVPLTTFAAPDTTRVLARHGEVRGFVSRAPWGGGATVAGTVDDALTLLEARLVAAGPERTVRCGITLENVAGAEALAAAGWTEAWRAPRLVRGRPLRWEPTMIWGQFNAAMG